MLEKMKLYKKPLIIVSSIVFAIIIGLILFYNIPRLEYYYDTKTDSYTVTRVYGDAKSYTIPSMHEGKKVTKIGVRAFFQKSNLEEVIFEDNNVINVARLAFSECPKLSKVDLSKVELIERDAFSYCVSLDNLVLDAKYIAGSAFYGCTSLKNITIGTNVISIGSMAFGKTSLETINIPSNVKEVYNEAFCDCEELVRINVYGGELKHNTYLLSLNIANFID